MYNIKTVFTAESSSTTAQQETGASNTTDKVNGTHKNANLIDIEDSTPCNFKDMSDRQILIATYGTDQSV